ncbi:MAG: FtsX-like permease family protein [Eggerthellaceae bacterium]|nr:FtsX-like permease family protein [Eggerthellaceae bacterium]
MRSAFNKEILRSISGSAARFVAIVLISFLGAGFYAGLRMAAPDMRIAGDEFFDGAGLYDVAVVSTLGFDDESVELLRSVEGVGGVMPVRHVDAMAIVGESSYAASVESLPLKSAQASDTSDGVHSLTDDRDYLNRPILEQGCWPASDTECVIGIDAALELGISVGDEITLAEEAKSDDSDDKSDDDSDDADGDDERMLAKTDLTVVGFVSSPAFCASSMLGTTSLGTGEVELYLYTGDDTFDTDLPYTMVYLEVPAAASALWDSSDYENSVAEVMERIEELAPTLAKKRYDTVFDEAQEELDDAWDEYLEERTDAEDEIDDAYDELVDAHAELVDARAELDDAAKDIRSGRSELEKARKKLVSAYDELKKSHKQLESSHKQLDASYSQLQQTHEQLEEMRQAIEAGVINDPQSLAQYEYAVAEYEKGLAKYEAGLETYTKGLAKYEAGLAEYEKGKKEYEKGVANYKEGLVKYNDGVAEYNDGVAEYNDGVAEYEDGIEEAYEEFDDAERELADAQVDINDIDYPEVFVIDRTKNAGAASLSSDAEGIDQIALFLPYFFFLVAALVALTSMTRMVEEERLNIGTHKALGYGKARITSKYLIYGALASGVGSALGTVALGKMLPWFILVSYGISYAVPVYPTPIDMGLAIRGVGCSVGITLLATWLSAASTLRSRPATLMLPRAPKAGKRIFLERIQPLWSRMSFSQKVTARNLLRYKRRFFMAVIGVSGCTALLLIGFGLRDAIGGIVDKQYEVLTSYDAIVRVDDEIEGRQRGAIEASLAKDDVESCLWVADFNLIAEGGEDDLRIEVVVPSDSERLEDFVTLRDRETGDPVELGGNRIVLTEKAAKVIGVQAGDTVILYDENDVGDKTGDGRSFVVGGVTENYLGHFAYLLPQGYEEAFGEEATFNVAYAKLADEVNKASFSARLLALAGVDTVSFVSDKMATYEGMLDVMNKLIFLIMALSAALAFVVLYNLTNINITERIREIATLKVLGFTRSEANAYIFREIMVMSLIGALFGCVLGVPLTLYIAEAAETANMMFARAIEPMSFVFSFVLTILFTVLVMFTMRGKLARVNMVESLKSIE